MAYQYDKTAYNAALFYDELGPAARPLEFPSPTVHRAARGALTAVDHRTGKIHTLKNVLMRKSGSVEHAYLIKKKLSKSIFGAVRHGVVLRRRSPHARRRSNNESREEQEVSEAELVEWESTEQFVAIKISSWANIRRLRGRHLEDPIKEISAMQLVGDYHPNVVGSIECLQDEDYLYSVMPYYSGGDLYSRISPPTDGKVDENQARNWFRQVLSALFHLQRKGVCHRDLSLENLMLDDKDNLVVTDLGMSLRVPHADPANYGGVVDVSEGTERRLMHAQGQGGNLVYMAPEIVARDDAFDGFTIDLWSSGVLLFVMLVGLAPFNLAHASDSRYASIAQEGKLHDILVALNIRLSEEALDLLQNMLWENPQKRFTLAQVMQHPWMMGQKFKIPKQPQRQQKQPQQQQQRGLMTHPSATSTAHHHPSMWNREVTHI